MKPSIIRTLGVLRGGGWYTSWELFDNHCKRISELRLMGCDIESKKAEGKTWNVYHLVSEPPVAKAAESYVPGQAVLL